MYLLAAAGVSCLISINALRTNNLTMVRLREQVYVADKDNGDVRAALTDLQRYVTSHMNTDLTPGKNAVYPPIQLKYTYERLRQASTTPVSNEQLYSDAQKHCEQLNDSDFSGRNRIPCIQEYVTTRAAAQGKPVPDSAYKYDFVSPTWSPDLAGWSVLSTFTLLAATAALFLLRRAKLI
jgi:hypothetical protein